ncbi:hypothetical protein WAF17_06810 [Bernardetia sp. ABR2-2B]|uniref:hypothetical protein n=1 Tax=Bernardetia sp. ABR2-2B TaxID=3127472 RepID=UPI0030D01A88
MLLSKQNSFVSFSLIDVILLYPIQVKNNYGFKMMNTNKLKKMTLLKNTLVIFALLFLFSCTANQGDYTIPTDAYIVAKFVVLDEKLSPKNQNCVAEINNFKKFDFHKHCSFLLEEMEFDIDEQYIFDKSGELIGYLDYKSEGAIIYSWENSENLSDWDSLYQNNKHSFLEDKKYIIDSSDTLEIERIFSDEKLIFTKRTQKQIEDSRRVIYQYE